MARKCVVTGKKTQTGNNRPFSLKATKRTFKPNLFKKRIYNPLTGKVERMLISAKGIKTLKKWAKDQGYEVEIPKTPTPGTKNEEKHRVKKEKLTPKQKKELAAQKEAELLGKGKSVVEDMETNKEDE